MCDLKEHNQVTYDKIIKEYEKVNDILVVQGTGTGKSFLAMALMTTKFKDSKILYVMPKYSVETNIKTYDDFKDIHNVDFKTYNYFNSVQKVDNVFNHYDVLIIDEAHHLGSDIYGKHLVNLIKMIRKTDNKYVLGLTATPDREDGIKVEKYFSSRIDGYSIFDCIEKGLMPQIEYLICEPDMISKLNDSEYNTKISFNDSEEMLKSIVNDNPKDQWLCFFHTVDEIDEHRELINSLFPDHRILEVHSKNDKSLEQIESIQKGEKVVICSVDMLLEGLHLPHMEGIILFRNVWSTIVFQQIIGRVSSIGNKTNPFVIDCTDVASRMLLKLQEVDRQHQARKQANREITSVVDRPIFFQSLKNKRYFDLGQLYIKSQSDKFYFRGEEYNTILECCENFGVKYKTINEYKISNNIDTFEEALEQNLQLHENDGVELYGKKFKTIKEACDFFSVNYRAVINQRKRHNYTVEDAIAKVRYLNKPKYIINKKSYNSVQEICDDLNISSGRVRSYLSRKHMSVEEAVEYCLNTNVKSKARSCNVFGKEFKSISSACTYFGVSSRTVIYFIRKKDLSVEDAISLARYRGMN